MEENCILRDPNSIHFVHLTESCCHRGRPLTTLLLPPLLLLLMLQMRMEISAGRRARAFTVFMLKRKEYGVFQDQPMAILTCGAAESMRAPGSIANRYTMFEYPNQWISGSFIFQFTFVNNTHFSQGPVSGMQLPASEDVAFSIGFDGNIGCTDLNSGDSTTTRFGCHHVLIPMVNYIRKLWW